MAATFGFSTTGKEVVQAFTKNVKGKTIVITGASDGGLGSQTALDLAKGGPAQMILLARSAAKVEPVIHKIQRLDASIEAFFVPIELDKLTTVQKAAEQINAKISKLDLLVNCAGIMGVPYSVNDLGIEAQMATNHVGHFVLTKHLLPKILAAAPGSRIVNVSSNGYMISPVHFDDIDFDGGKSYDPWTGYGQSKTANVLFTQALAQRLASHGVTSVACHPGVILETSLSNHLDFAAELEPVKKAAMRNTGRDFNLNPPKTLEQGVSTIVRAAIDPELKSGSMLMDCQYHEIWEYARSGENARKLWDWTEKVTGERFSIE